MAQIADRYAKTLYELSVAPELIESTAQILASVPEVLKVLASPLTSINKKEAVIERIFPKQMTAFLKIVCKKGRAIFLPEIFEAYKAYAASLDKQMTAELFYVTPPTEAQLEGMKSFLKKKYKMSDVTVEMKEDKSLLGGFLLSAAGEEYDYSLRGRFAKLEQQLIRR